MGSVFIYIVKFIIEINTVIKLAPGASATSFWMRYSARGSAVSILGH